MAQLSRLAQLYLRISDNLTEDDVRNLRSLLSLDKILGKAKVEKATPLEIFDMLVDNDTIGKGNLGLLVQILRCLGKGKLAKEAEDLEQEEKQKINERKKDDTTGRTPESNVSKDTRMTTEQHAGAATVIRDSGSDDNESEDTEVKGIISVKISTEASNTDDQKTSEDEGDIDLHSATSELACLHIREMERLMEEPMKAPGLGPSGAELSTDNARLETLLAELDTPAAMTDQEKQCNLYCQIGDLYRAKLYNLKLAFKYYQSMLECSKALSEDIKQAKAHNRLGLTYDIMGEHEEAVRNHERVLGICRIVGGDDVDICVAYKNLASSFILSDKVSDATTNYKTALRLAMNTRNKIEEMDIHCKLGDLHRQHLNAPHVSHKYYTKMLELAKDSGSKYWKMQAYNRLGLACGDMQDNELALEWHQKALMMSKEIADKREQMINHLNISASLGKVNQAKSHLDTALQLAEQKGDQYGQMSVYMHMGDMQREKFSSPRTAIQYYEQYLSIASQLGDRREEGKAYSRLGQAHYEMGEFESALEWYEKHMKISQERDDKKEEVRAHVSVGNVYRFLGKIEQATSHFDTALQMAQQEGDEPWQMAVYINMGDMQREQLHSPRTAIRHYKQYLALAMQLGDRHEEGVAYNKLGRAHYDMEEYEAGLEWDKKDLKIRQERGDKANLLITHNCMAASYTALGKPDQARFHYQSAMTIAKETGDKQEQMDINLNLGDLHGKQLHEPQVSYQYYTEMLQLAKDLGRKDKERLAYNRLGLACDDMQDHEAALGWCQKYLKMSQETGDKKEEMIAHKNIGDTYQSLGKLELAKSHYHSAMTIAEETGKKQEQMDINFELGDLHREQLHEPRVSHKYYAMMLTLARDLENKDKERVAYNRLGRVHYAIGEYAESLDWAKKDLNISRENGDKNAQITIYQNIAANYKAMGKLDLAKSHYQSAMTLAKETGNKQEQEDIAKSLKGLQTCIIS